MTGIRLQTKYNRAIRAAIRAQTGYRHVSNVRLRSVVVPCVRCGKALRFEHGCFDCCSMTDEDRGCYSFGNSPSRRYELRHDRRRRARTRAADAKAGPWWIRCHIKRAPIHWLIDGQGHVAHATADEEPGWFWAHLRGERNIDEVRS